MQSYNFTKVFSAACLGMLVFGVVMLTLGSVLPDVMLKFNIDELAAGSLASLLPLGILVGSIIFGPVVDKYSYKYFLIGCFICVTVGMFGIAEAKAFVVLQLAFFLIGIGGGGLNGATNALVADISRAHQKKESVYLSALGIFFGVGALLVPSLLGLFTGIYDYEDILFFLSGGILILVIPLLFLEFPQPKLARRLPLVEGLRLFKNPALLVLASILFFHAAFEGVFNNWSTVFMERNKGLGQSQALACLSLYIGGLTVARLFLVALFRVVRDEIILLTSILLMMSALTLIIVSDGIGIIFLAVTLIGVGTAGIFPVILGYVSRLYDELRATAIGVVIFLAVLGNILLNVIMGFLAKTMGIGAYQWLLAFCICSVLVIVLLRKRTLN
ncbi:MAG: MFS transporter [Saprospiraceae bacterium]|nr:MFS transporter [Saprospiraceae bacterium]